MSILIETLQGQHGKIGVMLLNRPQVINALNMEMCKISLEALTAWKEDPQIKAIFIHGNGERGFCSGGDVKAVRELNLSDQAAFGFPRSALDFFAYEYLNDLCICRFPKPIIVWSHGITMGGGIGVYQGASHRVVTENSLFAMPEINIGFFPDVGASYFLNQMPPGVGLFLGLTAARMNPFDAIDAGLGDFFLPNDKKGSILDDLMKAAWSESDEENHLLAAEILTRRGNTDLTRRGNTDLTRRGNTDLTRRGHLNSALSGLFDRLEGLEKTETAGEAIHFLEDIGKTNALVAESLQNTYSSSPLSLAITKELLKRGKGLDEFAAFQMEYNLALAFCLDSDFKEGVRTRLVDKGATPTWKFPNLQSVPESLVQDLFLDPFASALSQYPNRFLELANQHRVTI